MRAVLAKDYRWRHYHDLIFDIPSCFCLTFTLVERTTTQSPKTVVVLLNPLSPNSDQHQISPCKINAYSIPEVMRIKDMITQGFLDISKILPSTFIRKVWGQERRICSLILGVKGLRLLSTV